MNDEIEIELSEETLECMKSLFLQLIHFPFDPDLELNIKPIGEIKGIIYYGDDDIFKDTHGH